MEKIWINIRIFFTLLFNGFKNANDIAFTGNKDTHVANGSSIEQQKEVQNVYKDMLKGELTQEVIELRHEMYFAERASKKYKYTGNGRAIKQNNINEYKKREEELKNQPLKPLIKPDVTNLKYWKGYKGFARIYINTTDGSFYYDIRKKEWGYKETDDDNRTLSDFDMEHIRRDAFSKLGVTTEEQFARWKGEAY